MAWALLALLLGQTPFASVGIEPQKTIIDLAFDPADFTGAKPFISIRYLGDDYAYPVYAIAIDRECRVKAECDSTTIARMVRSPNFKTVKRPRWAGMAVVGHVHGAKATTRDEIASALDTAGLEWVEANLKNCPRAAAIFADLSSVTKTENSEPRSPGEAVIYYPMALHADRVSVAFDRSVRGPSVYSGVVGDAGPTGWAIRLAEALEPCWRPSGETPPWRR